jgi:hypothetical protein
MSDKPNCYSTRVEDDEGGRWAKPLPHVIGTAAQPPSLPPANWSHDPSGIEPPLGVCVDAMEACGTPAEVQRSIDALGAAPAPCPYATDEGCALVTHEIGPCVCFGGQA